MNSRNEVSFWWLESEGIENEKRRNAVRINPFLGRPLERPRTVDRSEKIIQH
jgi:hypothetical protein